MTESCPAGRETGPRWRSLRRERGTQRRRVRRQDLPSGTFVRDAVVLGCDGGQDGDAAVRFAVREAQLRKANLVVMIAYFGPVDPDLESIETPGSELRSKARSRAESALCRALGLPVWQLPPHQIVTELGPPTRVLLHEYGGAQLLVVGLDGRQLFARMLHGPSVGEELARRSAVPVVLVPPASGGPSSVSPESLP